MQRKIFSFSGRIEIQTNQPEKTNGEKELGKKIQIINFIVKDAKIIHKPIRDAISGVVIYFLQLKEMFTKKEYKRYYSKQWQLSRHSAAIGRY